MPRLAAKNLVAQNFKASSQTIEANDNKMGQKQTSENNFLIHAVQPKETVYSIARKYNVSPDDMANWNQLRDYDLKIGQTLKIYR